MLHGCDLKVDGLKLCHDWTSEVLAAMNSLTKDLQQTFLLSVIGSLLETFQHEKLSISEPPVTGCPDVDCLLVKIRATRLPLLLAPDLNVRENMTKELCVPYLIAMLSPEVTDSRWHIKLGKGMC